MTLFLTLLACAGASTDTGAGAAVCGDPDGEGTDTGDLPNVLGGWTSTFAQNDYDSDCAASNFDENSETWIGAFTLDGRAPDALYMSFGRAETERFWGAMDKNGGMTLTGTHAHSEGTIYANFSGLVYHDQYSDHDFINGGAFLGLDTDGDGKIDCGATGTWKAIKSGF